MGNSMQYYTVQKATHISSKYNMRTDKEEQFCPLCLPDN